MQRSSNGGKMSAVSTSPSSTTDYSHRLRPLRGRDPHEPGRAASPLELLYDLTFVVAIGVGASNFAEVTAAGHFTDAFIGFGFAMFAITWAWINFSWFASAFDTDDWLYRLSTMVQMVGVVILALGIPEAFKSIEHHGNFDNRLMVMGYVVMRVPLVSQWLRAARACTGELRRTAQRYAIGLLVIQAVWTVYGFVDMTIKTALITSIPIMLAEFALPYVAERRHGTPWHPHHIAERYSLFVIIALGEGVVGTVASSQELLGGTGWSFDSVTVVVAGIGLTFGLWWLYFILPFAQVLHRKRASSFIFGYGHMLLFASIAAIGAGLHLVGLWFEQQEAHQTKVSALAAVAMLVIPAALFLLLVFSIFQGMTHMTDAIHFAMLASGLALAAAALIAVALGAPVAVGLIIVTLVPWSVVVWYEATGHRHMSRYAHGTEPQADH